MWLRQKVDAISAQGRMATGVRLQQMEEDDKVVSVTPLVEAKVEALEGEDQDLQDDQDEPDVPEIE